MTYKEFIIAFREYLTSDKYSDDEIIHLADEVGRFTGVANYVDYIVYCRGIARTSIIEKAGQLVPELHNIVKELGIKY